MKQILIPSLTLVSSPGALARALKAAPPHKVCSIITGHGLDTIDTRGEWGRIGLGSFPDALGAMACLGFDVCGEQHGSIAEPR